MLEENQKLPNAVATLVLGICSLLLGCLFVGLVCGIVGIAISSKGKRMYQQNPSAYDNYGVLNAGRIMSIIGVVFGAIYLFWYVIAVLILGSSASILSMLM